MEVLKMIKKIVLICFLNFVAGVNSYAAPPSNIAKDIALWGESYKCKIAANTALLPPSVEAMKIMLKNAQKNDSKLNSRLEELEGEKEFLNSFKNEGPWLVKVGESYQGLSDREMESLAAQVGLMFLLFDDDGVSAPAIPGNSQFHVVVNAAIETAYRRWKLKAENPNDSVNQVDASQFAADAIYPAMEEIGAKNRAEIRLLLDKNKKEIEQVKKDREFVAWIAQTASECKDRTMSVYDQPTVLTQEGFYGVKRKGSGWRKMYGGAAYFISGYDIHPILVSSKVTQPKKGHYYRTVPVGYDLSKLFNQWKIDEKERSKKFCKLPAQACPCRYPPDIWVDGPEWSIVSGKRAKTLNEFYKNVADPNRANLSSGAANHWKYDKNRKLKEAQAACGQ